MNVLLCKRSSKRFQHRWSCDSCDVLYYFVYIHCLGSDGSSWGLLEKLSISLPYGQLEKRQRNWLKNCKRIQLKRKCADWQFCPWAACLTDVHWLTREWSLTFPENLLGCRQKFRLVCPDFSIWECWLFFNQLLFFWILNWGVFLEAHQTFIIMLPIKMAVECCLFLLYTFPFIIMFCHHIPICPDFICCSFFHCLGQLKRCDYALAVNS